MVKGPRRSPREREGGAFDDSCDEWLTAWLVPQPGTNDESRDVPADQPVRAMPEPGYGAERGIRYTTPPEYRA